MKLKKAIRTLFIGVALISAALFTVDAIAGIVVSITVERHLGQRLLAVADDPNLGRATVAEFLTGLPPPRTLHKDIFSTRQVMQRLSCDGFAFMLSVLIGYMMRDKTRQQGDTPNPHSPSALGVEGR